MKRHIAPSQATAMPSLGEAAPTLAMLGAFVMGLLAYKLDRLAYFLSAGGPLAGDLHFWFDHLVIHPRDSDWATASMDFPLIAGSRQIFDLEIDMVQTSCGTGVPVMKFVESRAEKELVPFYEDMGPEGVTEFWGKKNTLSIDGRPTGIFDDV